jgi:hypothetical protein
MKLLNVDQKFAKQMLAGRKINAECFTMICIVVGRKDMSAGPWLAALTTPEVKRLFRDVISGRSVRESVIAQTERQLERRGKVCAQKERRK